MRSAPRKAGDAVWLIDLKDKEDPRLVFSHPVVDVPEPHPRRDGRMVGARYDNGNPMIFYTDERHRGLDGRDAKARAGHFQLPAWIFARRNDVRDPVGKRPRCADDS